MDEARLIALARALDDDAGMTERRRIARASQGTRTDLTPSDDGPRDVLTQLADETGYGRGTVWMYVRDLRAEPGAIADIVAGRTTHVYVNALDGLMYIGISMRPVHRNDVEHGAPVVVRSRRRFKRSVARAIEKKLLDEFGRGRVPIRVLDVARALHAASVSATL